MIKNYLQLSKEEQEKVYSFFTKDKSSYTNLEDMDKDLKSDLFGFGEGVLFNFHQAFLNLQIVS